ncbi:MAG: hypothetical protein SVR04_02515 [Spirochaetota bacterium]|nr:hypothetical protein [Spirochaetota bacterium]
MIDSRTEGAERADKDAKGLDAQEQRRREKQAAELQEKAAGVVYFKHSKNGAVSAMSPGLAELMQRKHKGRIISKPPEIDLEELLNEGAEK